MDKIAKMARVERTCESGGERLGLRGEKEEWLRRGRVLSERVGLKKAEKMERDGLRKRNRRKQERKTWSRIRMSSKNRGRESDMSDSGEGNKWWDKRVR